MTRELTTLIPRQESVASFDVSSLRNLDEVSPLWVEPLWADTSAKPTFTSLGSISQMSRGRLQNDVRITLYSAVYSYLYDSAGYEDSFLIQRGHSTCHDLSSSITMGSNVAKRCAKERLSNYKIMMTRQVVPFPGILLAVDVCAEWAMCTTNRIKKRDIFAQC